MNHAIAGRLHVIVNPTIGDAADALTRAVLEAGAPVLQIRVKDVDDDHQRLWLTQPLVELAHRYGATAIVNDRADMAVVTDAEGVHGGANDLPCGAMRRVVGPDRLVGMTARTPEAAVAYQEAGADYVGVGPVYRSVTKAGLPEPLGTEVVEAVSSAVSIPVIAISGITVDRVPELLAAGAHGVAVIGSITAAEDPGAETRRFLEALEAR